jgi:hypothetical protein
MLKIKYDLRRKDGVGHRFLIQEPEKPERDLVSQCVLYVIRGNEGVWDIGNLLSVF